MPNPNRDPDTQRFTNPPQPTDEGGHDWSQLGVSFEEAQNAVNMQNQLANVNTRRAAMEKLYNPQHDAAYLAPVEQPEAPGFEYPAFGEEPEMEEQYYQQPPQPQGPSPQQIFEIMEQRARAAEARAREGLVSWEDINKMMADQQLTEAAQGAVTEFGLPASDAGWIESQARNMAQQYPNRQAGDIAKDIARQRQAELTEWASRATPPPLGTPTTPGGPVPAPFEAGPPDGMDAAEWASQRSREGLD